MRNHHAIKKIFLLVFLFFQLATTAIAQLVSCDSVHCEKIKSQFIQEHEMNSNAIVKVSPCVLKSSANIFFYEIDFSNPFENILKGKDYCIVIDDTIYFRNETNSRTCSKQFQIISNLLKTELSKRDYKFVMRHFELKVWPGKF